MKNKVLISFLCLLTGKMNVNPWQVDSIWDFSFLHCPECSFNTQEEEFFQTHAVENHPLSLVLFAESVIENSDEVSDIFKKRYKHNENDNNLTTPPSQYEYPEIKEELVEESYEDEVNFEHNIEGQDTDNELDNPNEYSFDTEIKKETILFEYDANHSGQNFNGEYDFQEKQNYVENRETIWKGDPLSFSKGCLSKSLVPNSDGTYSCFVCYKKFNKKTILKDHMKNVHEKIKPIICHVCNERYAKRHLMEKHFKVWGRS